MKWRLSLAVLVTLVALAWAAPAPAQTTTVDFDNPTPPGTSGGLLEGVFQGIDFGSGQWRWEGPFTSDPTNHIYFDSGTSRTLQFSPAPRFLTSIRVFTTAAGTLTISDNLGQTLTRPVSPGSLDLVSTGWGQASTVVTVTFSAGWDLGVDDIAFTTGGTGADTTPPTISVTAPLAAAVVAGVVTISAQASDNVGVAGVRFLLNGAPLGTEITQPPYTISWNTATVANGRYTLTAVARDAATNQTMSAPVQVTAANGQAGGGAGYALRFYGNGTGDIDRVKILIDDPATTAPGPPADVGATDFTIELWLRALAAENPAPAVGCGANNNWIFGNIVVDRDRYNQGRAFGLSIAGGVMAFGVTGDGTGARTICGATNVTDGQWHHVAVQRRRSDGWLWIYVDGRLEAQGDGPDGDVSYPDAGVPGNFCGGPCTNSDPYLVLGAEKHDAGSQFPSFSGWLDELRISRILRYGANFTRPATAFLPDANTVALYHFDEGGDDVIIDTPGVGGGPSHGVRRFGGSPAGPAWVASDAPLAPGPAYRGSWSDVINLPLVAVNMMLLHTGQVLMWDGDEFGMDARLYHPALGTFTAVPIGTTNIFCSGQVTLADGRALVVGGHQADFVGLPDANLFDPVTQSWQPAAPMAFGRWYPTATTLPDGRVLVVSGSTTCSTCIADTPEVYDPAANTWTALNGARLTMPLYPFMFVLPDGQILYAGSDEASTITRALDVTSQSWTTIDPVIVPGGSAAMYRPGVVLKAGAPADTYRPAEPAVDTAYVLDMNQPAPAWRQVGSMAFPRAYHTMTLLPDGTVAATGGVQTTGVASGPPVYPAEIWNPVSETWSTMASMQIRRSYHSTSLLLPDGRVLVAGSGRSADVSQLNAEIFSPPYLFRGARPTITAVPATVGVGTNFFVGTPEAGDIESLTLIRLGAVTHGVDMDQRSVPLAFAPATNGLTVQGPANANLAPPGYYMLFLVNAAGVPSIGAFVRVTAASDAVPPTVTITEPTSNPTFSAGSSPLALGGSADDNVGVTQVTWTNDRGGSGTAAGTTAWSVAIGLQTGTNVLTVTARDAAGNTATDTLSVIYTPPDTTAPTVTITGPTSNATFATTSTPLALSGTAGDAIGVTQVTWSNDRGGSGMAAGTTAWSVAAIALQTGTNVLTVTARDAAGNTATDTLTVTYTPPDTTAPTVAITAPTTDPTFDTASSPLGLSGTAGDSVGVTQVTWTNDRGGSGTASGTTTWSIATIALQPGANVLTITARDAAGNTATDFLGVNYTPADATAPTVSITTPTSNPTLTTGSSSLALGGSANDNVGVTQVAWTNDRGGSGTASGTTTWSVAAIALQTGTNVLTVTARDAIGNTATDTLTVTYTPPANGLVAAYSFNETSGTIVADTSGNGNTGTISGATRTTLGRFGGALAFDGVNGWVTVADSPSLDLTTGMTMEAWVYPTVTPSGWRTIVEKEGTGSVVAYYLQASSLSADQPAMGVRIGSVEQELKGGSRLTANVWAHLAVTYDGATMRLYVNGVEVTSRAQTGLITTTTSPLRIGGNAVWGEFFQGRIDEIRLYNRALSQAEIQIDMNTPVAP